MALFRVVSARTRVYVRIADYSLIADLAGTFANRENPQHILTLLKKCRRKSEPHGIFDVVLSICVLLSRNYICWFESETNDVLSVGSQYAGIYLLAYFVGWRHPVLRLLFRALPPFLGALLFYTQSQITKQQTTQVASNSLSPIFDRG